MSMLFHNTRFECTSKAGTRLRRCKLTLLALGCALGISAQAQQQPPQPAVAPASATEIAQPALFDAIASRAKLLAKREYKPIQANIPEALANMNYDQYRSIRFRADASLWHNESLFELQLFHPGFLYKEPVVLHMATDGPDSFVQFKQEYFNYDGPAAPLAGVAPNNIGFAGFRIHYPLNSNEYKDVFHIGTHALHMNAHKEGS